MPSIFTLLFEAYPKYKNNSITKRRIKYKQFKNQLDAIAQLPQIKKKEIGTSIEGRSINLIRIGRGKRNILFWSQMHGDEATATMALFDIFNFFSQRDNFDDFRQEILEEFSLFFIPVLNPDGMEKFQRRNAIDVDLNRDADKLRCPESKILKMVRDEIDAEFGFNLHDQDTRYTVGNKPYPATISFLAPAFDPARSLDNVRLKAVQLIGLLFSELQAIIPGQVAKYTDEYEPRAFGENMQKWGTSTVLVESGGYQNDTEKQEIRKLNFVLLLGALSAIKSNELTKYDDEYYDKIPFNGKFLFDLLLKNISVNTNNQEILIDIGINRKEINIAGKTEFYYRSEIEDLGDLSNYFGYEELNCEGLSLEQAKCAPVSLPNIEEVNEELIKTLLLGGYTYVMVQNHMSEGIFSAPMNIISQKPANPFKIVPGEMANFYLLNGDTFKYAVINGFIYDFDQPALFEGYGLWT